MTKKKSLQKLMALMLTIVMLTGSVMTVSADTAEEKYEDGKEAHIQETSKEAVKRVAIDEWEIKLKFTPTMIEMQKATPVDVALVVDTSGSMNLNGNDRLSVAKDAISEFVNSIPASADVRVSLTKFNSESTGSFTGTKTVQGLTDNYEDILAASKALKAGGGTNTEKGLLMGADTFEEGNTEREEIMIIISDGLPTHYLAADGVTELGNGDNTTTAEKNAAIAAADQIKEDGVEIYSIGLDINAQVLKDIAGDNNKETDDAAYYRTIKSGATDFGLDDFLEEISVSIAGSGLMDKMGDHFDLVEGSEKMVINAETADEKEDGVLTVNEEGTIYWSPKEGEELGTETRTLTYRVKIDPTLGEGAYKLQETNGTTQYDYWIGETKYYEPFTSPEVEFNIAEAEVAVTGLPEGVESGVKLLPTLQGEAGNKIITGYDEEGQDSDIDIKDTLGVYAPVVEDKNGVKYYPTVEYVTSTVDTKEWDNDVANKEVSEEDKPVDGLEINKSGDQYSINHKNLGAGTYRFTVTYSPKPINVIFVENGGSDVEDKIVDQGSLVPTEGTDTSRVGFEFTGWYVDEDLTTLWDFDTTKVEEEVTLYAGWKETTTGTGGTTTPGDGGTTDPEASGTTSGSTTPPTNPLTEALPTPVAAVVGAIAPLPTAAIGAIAETADSAVIDEVEVPLASAGASWSLLDLILTVVTGLMSVTLLVTYLSGRREDEEYIENGEQIKRRGIVRALSIIPMIGAIILFVLTQDMTLPMVIVDEWTIIFAAITLIQAGVMFLSRKKVEEAEEFGIYRATA